MVVDISPKGAFLVPRGPVPDSGGVATLELETLGLGVDVRIVRRTAEGIGVEFADDVGGAIAAGWIKGRNQPLSA